MSSAEFGLNSLICSDDFIHLFRLNLEILKPNYKTYSQEEAVTKMIDFQVFAFNHFESKIKQTSVRFWQEKLTKQNNSLKEKFDDPIKAFIFTKIAELPEDFFVKIKPDEIQLLIDRWFSLPKHIKKTSLKNLYRDYFLVGAICLLEELGYSITVHNDSMYNQEGELDNSINPGAIDLVRWVYNNFAKDKDYKKFNFEQIKSKRLKDIFYKNFSHEEKERIRKVVLKIDRALEIENETNFKNSTFNELYPKNLTSC